MMDGPAMIGSGGAAVIATGVVEIGADMAGLRAGEEEARQIVDRLGKLAFTAVVGLDVEGLKKQADDFARTFSPPPLKWRVELDTSTVQQQMEMMSGSASGHMGNFAGMGGGSPSFGAAAGGETAAQAVNAATGGSGSGGGGSRGGTLGGRNPLSVRGAGSLLGLGTGGFVAAYLASEAVNLAGGFVAADQIAEHPERIQRSFDRVGGMRDAMSDPFLRGQSQVLAGIESSKAATAAMEGIPLIGGLIRLADASTGYSAELGDRAVRVSRGIEVGELVDHAGNTRLMQAAEMTGAAGDIARERVRQREIPIAVEAGKLATLQAQRDAAIASRTGADDPHNPYRGIADVAGITAAVDKDFGGPIEQARRALAELKATQAQDKEIIARASISDSAAHAYAAASASAMGLQTTAQQTLAGRGLGSTRAAMYLQQEAERDRYNAETHMLTDTATPSRRSDIASGRAAGYSLLTASQGAQRSAMGFSNDQSINNADAEGSAARLRARHEAYAAETAMFEAHAREEIAIATMAGAGVLNAVKGSLDQQRQARAALHSQEVSNENAAARVSFDTSMLAGEGAMLRATGHPHAAQMLQYQARQEHLNERGRLAFQGPLATLPARLAGLFGEAFQLHAEAGASEYEYQHGMAIQSVGLQARRGAAEARIANHPLYGRAIGDVAAARIAVAQAEPGTGPGQRGEVLATEQAELRAAAHDISYRSGAVGMAAHSLDAALLATGFGMDLGGAAKDRRLAMAEYQRGINGADNPIGPMPPGAGRGGGLTFEQMKQALDYMLGKAKIKFPMLFSN